MDFKEMILCFILGVGYDHILMKLGIFYWFSKKYDEIFKIKK